MIKNNLKSKEYSNFDRFFEETMAKSKGASPKNISQIDEVDEKYKDVDQSEIVKEERKSPEFFDLQKKVAEYEDLAPEIKNKKEKLNRLEDSAHNIFDGDDRYSPQQSTVIRRINLQINAEKEGLKKDEAELLKLLTNMRKDISGILSDAKDDSELNLISKFLRDNIADKHLRNHLLNEHTKESFRRLKNKGLELKTEKEESDLIENSKKIAEKEEKSKGELKGNKIRERVPFVDVKEVQDHIGQNPEEKEEELIGEITKRDNFEIPDEESNNDLIGEHDQEDGTSEDREKSAEVYEKAHPNIPLDDAKIDSPPVDDVVIEDGADGREDSVMALDTSDVGDEKAGKDKKDVPDVQAFEKQREDILEHKNDFADAGIKVVGSSSIGDGMIGEIGFKDEQEQKTDKDKKDASAEPKITKKAEKPLNGKEKIDGIKELLRGRSMNEGEIKKNDKLTVDSSQKDEIKKEAEPIASTQALDPPRNEKSGLARIASLFVSRKKDIDSSVIAQGEKEIQKIRKENVER